VAIRDGRTSSEFIMKKNYAEELEKLKNFNMNQEETHVELAVVDKVGRMQIPSTGLSTLGINSGGRVKVEVEEDKVILYAAAGE